MSSKRVFCIISTDRHRDDIVYLFEGTLQQAKEFAKEKLFSIRKYDFEENSYDDGLVYHISMMGGDYSSSIYIPVYLHGKEEV